MKEFRLFIGNIPNGTTEQDLRQEFRAYGNIGSVELKTKPDQSIFGFINLETDDRMFNQCVREFSEEKFRGVFLTVSRAKESFLERLQRERQDAERNKKDDSKSDNTGSTTEVVGELPTFKAAPVVESESSSSSESEAEPEPEPARPAPRPQPKPRDPDEFVKKWNSEAYLENGRLKIVQITGDVKEVIDLRGKKKQPAKPLAAADEKRLKGLDQLKSSYDNQKKMIQSSLSGIDGPSNKKIRFDDDESAKPSLFDDDDDDDEDIVAYKKDFAVKKQFQGEGGEELLQLQSKYKTDDRFAIDSRFTEPTQRAEKKKKQKMTANDKEKEAQMKLLHEMGAGATAQKEKQKEMIRFDPTKTEHSKFIKRELPGAAGSTQTQQREDFQVSDDRYVKINANLKDAFETGGGFSLLQQFGQPAAKHARTEQEGDDGEIHQGKRFRYDSSDDEATAEPEAKKVIQTKPGEAKKKAKNIFREKFFFHADDPRLKEGLKFFTTGTTPRKTRDEMQVDRKALKRVVKDKVKRQNIRTSAREMYTKSFRKPVGRQFQRPKRKNFTKS